MCCFHMGIARKGWGVVKACKDGLEHFSPHVCPFDRGEGGLKLFGQCPQNQHISKRGHPLDSSFPKLNIPSGISNPSAAYLLIGEKRVAFALVCKYASNYEKMLQNKKQNCKEKKENTKICINNKNFLQKPKNVSKKGITRHKSCICGKIAHVQTKFCCPFQKKLGLDRYLHLCVNIPVPHKQHTFYTYVHII